jgi:YHS domain-containing protein
MLNRLLIIISTIILVSSITIAQEKPEKDNDQSAENTTSETTEVSEEAKTEVAWNKVCPVEGGPVEDDTPAVEYNGKLYGFCCPGCDTEFAENPEKYAKNLNESGTRFIGRK